MGASSKLFLDTRNSEQHKQLLRESKLNPIILEHYGIRTKNNMVLHTNFYFNSNAIHKVDTNEQGNTSNKNKQSGNRFPCTDEQPER